MSKDFDWQTDDHTTWVEEPPEVQPDSRRDSIIAWLRRWGRWLGLAAVLLLVVGLVIFSILNRRVEQAEDATIDDVLVAHSLIRQAAREKDFDLLQTMMSPSAGSDWRELQVDLLNVNLFLGRSQLNLNIDYDVQTSVENIPVVNLSPDLQSAELIERLPYEVANIDQISETIWLEHTFFYSRQDESWFLSSLPEDDEAFWGNWRTIEESNHLTLIYPARDEEFALEISPRLDALIGQICSHDSLECPATFALELRFSKEPSTLMRFNEDYRNLFLASFQTNYHLSLPSPTLIGRPVDEKSTEALYRGYANWLAAIMVYRYLDGGAFDGGVVLEADPFEQIMAGLELALPPGPTRAMPISSPLAAPPESFPDQDIMVACTDFSSYRLMRYNIQTNQWSDEIDDQQMTYLTSPVQSIGIDTVPLPDDSGFLVTVSDFESEENYFKMILWRDGQESIFLESDDMYQFLPPSIQHQFDPSGRMWLILDANYMQTDEGEDVQFAPYAINIEECLAGECVPQAYNGIPFWSPDLSWSLLVDIESQSMLTLRNELTGEEIPLGGGFSPYWIDEESFVYIQPEQEAEPNADPIAKIVQANVNNPLEETVIVTSAEIPNAINYGDSEAPVSFHVVVVHPDRPEWLFFSAAIHPELTPQQVYLLAFDSEAGIVDFQLEIESSTPFIPLQFIEDGNKLVVQTFDIDSPKGSLIVIPLNPEEKSAVPPINSYETNGILNNDWSLDHQWLLLVEADGIRLIAPGQNYDHTISFEVQSCYRAAWTNPVN